MTNEATDLVGGYEWSPTTKTIGELATQLTKAVEDGSIAVEKQVVRLRAFQQAIETALEQLKPELLDELGKYGKGEKCTSLGATLELREAGVKYDYANCNDPILGALLVEKDSIDKQVKDRQELLRKLKDMILVPDPETGEICNVYPPVKKSTTSYVLTFNQKD